MNKMNKKIDKDKIIKNIKKEIIELNLNFKKEEIKIYIMIYVKI